MAYREETINNKVDSAHLSEKKPSHIITGGLGISFSEKIEHIIEMGYVPVENASHKSKVGTWVLKNDKTDGFFNWEKKLVISPISNKIYDIKANKIYSQLKKGVISRECLYDYNALLESLLSKYPSLKKDYPPGIDRDLVRFVTLHEKERRGDYGLRRFSGRNIVISCARQLMNGDDLGITMLSVTYSGDFEAKKLLRKEQEIAFRKKSLDHIQHSGLQLDDL